MNDALLSDPCVPTRAEPLDPPVLRHDIDRSDGILARQMQASRDDSHLERLQPFLKPGAVVRGGAYPEARIDAFT
ncbi:hypothetical protein, partial [Klebsiella pneumoniae]|uniref:hypothetical protein n=1 Tax=Klebsiella pneumoniae TaxID=573 RepID=UPI0021CB5863